MKKWLIGTILIALFVTGINLLFSRGYFSGPLKRLAQNRIQQITDRSVRIGRVRMNLVPTIMTLEDLQLGPMPGDPPDASVRSSLKIREIQIQLRPWSLLTEALLIKRISLKGADLHLSLNDPLLLKPGALSERDVRASKTNRQKLVIREIRFTEGHFKLTGSDNQSLFEINDIAGDANPDLLLSRFEVNTTTGKVNTDFPVLQLPFSSSRLKLAVTPTEVELRGVELKTEKNGAILLTGKVGLPAPPSVQIRLSADLPLSDLLRPLSNSTEVDGRVHLSGEIRGPFNNITSEMELTLQDLIYRKARIGNLEAILDYRDREMTISNLSANWLDGVLSGRLTVRFPPNAMPDYHVVANWTDLRVGPMLREVLAPDWERNPLLAGELDLAWSGRDWTMATGQGRVHWTQEPAALTEKAPPMADLAAWATLLTDLQDAAVSFQAASGGWTVSAAQLRTSASDLELSGFIPVSHEGHSQSSSQREREGEAPTALLVEGATQAPTKGPMDLTLRFKTRALAEAARLAGMKQLDGSGRIEGRMTGSLQDPLFEGSLRLRKVRIRNQPVDSMASDITYRQRQLTFNHAVFRSGQGRYELRGLVQLPSSDSPLRFDLSAKIAGGDPKAVVAVFYKPLPIETAATGRLKVSGTPLEFTLQARLKVSGGGIYGQDLDEGETAFILTRREIRFDKSSGRRGKSRITGTGRIGFDGTFETSVVASHFSLGDITPLKPHLSGLEGSFSGSLTGQGELKNPQFHLNGRFEALRFRSQDLGPGPVSVRLEQKMVTVETDLRGLSGKATLLAADPYPYELSLDVREASLTDWISAAVPPKQPRPPILQIPVVATGSVSLQGRMTQIGRPSGKLDLEKLQIQAGELSLENDGPIRLTIVNGEVSLQSFRFKGPDTSLTFTGGLDLMNSYRLSIAGRTDLHIFRIFSRDLIGAKGAAVVGLEITDGWTNPKIRGGLTVKEAALRLSWLQHPIEIQTMTVAFSERQAVLENFEGTIFQGKTHATGQLGLQGFRISRYALMAETTKARLTGVPGLTAHLDASLIVQGQRAEKTDSPLSAKISGEIHVRKASYEKRVDWKTWVLDLIRPDQPAWIVPAAVGLTRLDLRLVGHEQIWIHNNLARVPLQLDLYIRGTLGNPIVLGRIETDEGRIFFQRNEFTLQSGTVDFISQERIRPVLDIRARTRTRVYSSATETSEYYTIDLALNGPIEKPVLTLSSDPPLRDQIEVLAILTFGRRPEDISQASAEIGTAEAATMVISEELQWLTTPFETITGADRFQVDLYASSTRATVEPRLTVEKRLWEDKVLVTYMKALDPSTEDIIRMEYLLGRNVSLIGERDELGSVGGDLKFRFEFR